MKSTMTLITLAAAMAVSAPMLASAQGQDTLPSIQVSPSRTVVVRYADLDTSTDWGMRLLHRRVNTATAQVCRFWNGRLEEVQAENRCRHGAKLDAMAQFQRNEQLRASRPEMASLRVTTH